MAGGALTGRFPALKHRNFRRYALGQVISLAGFWMQSVAQGWLVYRLSGSELALGAVAFVGYLPIFLFSPVAGVVADRMDKRTLILITQTAMMLLAAAQGLIVVTDVVTVPIVAGMAFCMGSRSARSTCRRRQSFMVELVGARTCRRRSRSTPPVFNTARVVGPAIAASSSRTQGGHASS